MPDPTPKGASEESKQTPYAPTTDKAFPDPSDLPPTHAEADKGKGDDENTLSPRDQAIETMMTQREEDLVAETKESQNEGLAGAPTPIEEPAPDPQPEPLPTEVAEDPLGEYAVMVDGKPMFKSVVNGKEQLIPFDKAREAAQKEVAVETRFRQASEFDKTLRAREQALLNNERAYNERTAVLTKSPLPAPADAGDRGGISDEDLEAAAADVANTLMTGKESDVAAELTRFAKSVRAPQAPVDEDAIVEKAAAKATETLTEDAMEKDAATGFEQFGKDYPDIMGDDKLYRYCDAISTGISKEHSDWTPTQIMQEAGRQTMDLVKSLRPDVPGEETAIPAAEDKDRHSRKEKLVPLPQARVAKADTVGEPDPNQPDSPKSVFAEMRKSRGQAV